MTKFLDARTFGSSLGADLAVCSHFHAAVSYIRSSGIKPLLELSPSQLIHSQIVTCTDFGITEPAALSALQRHGYRLKAFKRSGLHAKLWIVYFRTHSPVLYVGSSNLSRSANSTNTEANVRLMDPDTIGSAVRWFSSIATADLTFDVDQEWIDAYSEIRRDVEPREHFVPLYKTESVFTEPSGTWHSRSGGKTFLAQGIIEGVTAAAPSRASLLNRISTDNRARLVLLSPGPSTKSFRIAHDVLDATLNPTGPVNVQLGGGRREVNRWIASVWDFDSETSVRKNQERQWQEWFDSTTWKLSDFQYQILVDLNDLVPTIWVRPEHV